MCPSVVENFSWYLENGQIKHCIGYKSSKKKLHRLFKNDLPHVEGTDKKNSTEKSNGKKGIQTKCKFDKMQTDKMQKNDKMQIGQNAKVLNINNPKYSILGVPIENQCVKGGGLLYGGFGLPIFGIFCILSGLHFVCFDVLSHLHFVKFAFCHGFHSPLFAASLSAPFLGECRLYKVPSYPNFESVALKDLFMTS